jgi:hypothetical protein
MDQHLTDHIEGQWRLVREQIARAEKEGPVPWSWVLDRLTDRLADIDPALPQFVLRRKASTGDIEVDTIGQSRRKPGVLCVRLPVAERFGMKRITPAAS